MKSKTANSFLLFVLIASIPLFFVYGKPFLTDSSILGDLPFLPEGRMWEVFLGQVARIPHLCGVFIILAVFGYRRGDVFLSKGDLSSGAEKFKPFGIKDGESWWKIGRSVGTAVLRIRMAGGVGAGVRISRLPDSPGMGD